MQDAGAAGPCCIVIPVAAWVSRPRRMVTSTAMTVDGVSVLTEAPGRCTPSHSGGAAGNVKSISSTLGSSGRWRAGAEQLAGFLGPITVANGAVPEILQRARCDRQPELGGWNNGTQRRFRVGLRIGAGLARSPPHARKRRRSHQLMPCRRRVAGVAWKKADLSFKI